MKFLKSIGGLFKRIGKFLLSDDLPQIASYALGIAKTLQVYVPNRTIEEIVRVYRLFGVPLSQALADGELTQDDINMLIGRLASVLIERKFPNISTTQANVVANSAYLDAKQEIV